MNEQVTLQAEKEIEIRFSEVDSMNIVWHGSYVLYLEDAREAFGKKYNLVRLPIPSMFQPDSAARIPPR